VNEAGAKGIRANVLIPLFQGTLTSLEICSSSSILPYLKPQQAMICSTVWWFVNIFNSQKNVERERERERRKKMRL